MQNRLKRIVAFLCAFALLVTTILGSSSMILVKAADPQEPTPVVLDGFANVTISDFEDSAGNQMQEKNYLGDQDGEVDSFSMKDRTSFDKTLLSMKVKFTGGGGNARIDFAGSGDFTGLSIYSSTDGNYLQIWTNYGVTENLYGRDMFAESAGVSSFLDTEFLLQMSFEFGDYDNDGTADDLKLGVYINGKLYNDEVVTITGCDMSKIGNCIGLYREGSNAAIEVKSVGGTDTPIIPDEPQRPNEDLEKVTFAHYKVKDGTYEGAPDINVKGTYIHGNSVAGTVLCGDIQLHNSSVGEIDIFLGATSYVWHEGVRLTKYPASSDLKLIYQTETEGSYTEILDIKPDIAGIDLDEKFNLMWSMELVDSDNDSASDDLKIGLWFNGILYQNKYIYIKDFGTDKLGNIFATYCAEGTSVTLNSIPELTPPPVPPKKPNENFEKVTFEYFGLKDAIYKYDGTDYPTYEGKGTESLDQKVLCGDVRFTGKGENHLMVGGKNNAWHGLRFITQENGTIVLYWIDDEDMILVDMFDKNTAGATLIGEWLNLMISTEILDADGDGKKDDIELGVWFNGVLYREEFYTIPDKASNLGRSFGLDCMGEDNTIAIRSIPEFMKGFDYSVYHLTKDWEKTLLTAHKAEIAVGGSRDAEPFTGDLLEIAKVGLFGAIGLAAVVTGVYLILRRKRES